MLDVPGIARRREAQRFGRRDHAVLGRRGLADRDETGSATTPPPRGSSGPRCGFRRPGLPNVVRWPAHSLRSLMTVGTPASSADLPCERGDRSTATAAAPRRLECGGGQGVQRRVDVASPGDGRLDRLSTADTSPPAAIARAVRTPSQSAIGWVARTCGRNIVWASMPPILPPDLDAVRALLRPRMPEIPTILAQWPRGEGPLADCAAPRPGRPGPEGVHRTRRHRQGCRDQP